MVPSVFFCSVCTHQVSICKWHLPLFCCWIPCIHPVCGNEIGTRVKNQPAKLPLDGDCIHAAFPSSSLCHGPVSLCPLLPTSLSPSLLSIWSLSLPLFHWDSLCLLDSGLCCQACLWCDRLVSGLVVCIYLLLAVSLGHCLSRSLSATSTTLGSTWLSWSPALLSAQGLWTSCSWKVVMVRLVEPCLLGGFPRSLYLWLFIFNVFMWLLFWVQCWHSENSLTLASLLLFGTLSPIQWLFWQYGRGLLVVSEEAKELESCPHSPCSMGYVCLSVLYTGRFFTFPNRKTSVMEVPDLSQS